MKTHWLNDFKASRTHFNCGTKIKPGVRYVLDRFNATCLTCFNPSKGSLFKPKTVSEKEISETDLTLQSSPSQR